MSRIGFVGVGRMGSNMARHLKEKGYRIGAVYDVRKESAVALGSELGVPTPERLAEVSALSDVVITVVTDDAAMRSIFGLTAADRSFAGRCRRQSFHQLRHHFSRGPYRCGDRSRKQRARNRWKPAWPRASPRLGKARSTLMVGGDEAVFQKSRTAPARHEHGASPRWTRPAKPPR